MLIPCIVFDSVRQQNTRPKQVHEKKAIEELYV